CESLKAADQVGGWLHFGYAGANGSVQMEYWNGYPPITLVDADLDSGTAIKAGGTRFVSEADRGNGNVATVDVPGGYLTADKFLAKAELRSSQRVSKYELSCVRH
ncbi:MAG: hypothetical protein ACXVCK_21100, partial [Bdellovibrionota bacterium]